MILNPLLPPARLISIVFPPAAAVKLAVPAFVDALVATKFAAKVAFAVAPELITKISPVVRSEIESTPESTLKVSLPAPPVKVSLAPPPVIISTPDPPVIISTPAPPVMVKPSLCALKLILDPESCAKTVSIFVKVASEANT